MEEKAGGAYMVQRPQPDRPTAQNAQHPSSHSLRDMRKIRHSAWLCSHVQRELQTGEV